MLAGRTSNNDETTVGLVILMRGTKLLLRRSWSPTRSSKAA